MIVEVHVKNHTPPDWQATIMSVSVDFFHRGGGKSEDDKPNVNLPSGNGEVILYSANVDCVTQFTVYMAIRDRRGAIQTKQNSFKDPNGRECVEEGQDVTLGQARPVIGERLSLRPEDDVFEISLAE